MSSDLQDTRSPNVSMPLHFSRIPAMALGIALAIWLFERLAVGSGRSLWSFLASWLLIAFGLLPLNLPSLKLAAANGRIGVLGGAGVGLLYGLMTHSVIPGIAFGAFIGSGVSYLASRYGVTSGTFRSKAGMQVLGGVAIAFLLFHVLALIRPTAIGNTKASAMSPAITDTASYTLDLGELVGYDYAPNEQPHLIIEVPLPEGLSDSDITKQLQSTIDASQRPPVFDEAGWAAHKALVWRIMKQVESYVKRGDGTGRTITNEIKRRQKQAIQEEVARQNAPREAYEKCFRLGVTLAQSDVNELDRRPSVIEAIKSKHSQMRKNWIEFCEKFPDEVNTATASGLRGLYEGYNSVAWEYVK